jgi:hypothetical protein
MLGRSVESQGRALIPARTCSVGAPIYRFGEKKSGELLRSGIYGGLLHRVGVCSDRSLLWSSPLIWTTLAIKILLLRSVCVIALRKTGDQKVSSCVSFLTAPRQSSPSIQAQPSPQYSITPILHHSVTPPFELLALSKWLTHDTFRAN